MSQIRIIIGREFNERVRKKSFIVSTLLMPVLLLGLMLAPALIMQFSRGETKRIAVIDRSGLVLPQLESDSELAFEATDLPLDRARRELTDRFGILWIGPDPVAQPDDIRLYANASSSISIESNITGQIEKIVENEKLKGYDIENLAQILDEVRTRVTMQTFRNDESQEEDSAARSSAAATVAGFALGMLLYMFLLIYGAMVMQSVIEEKHSRVLEVMVSSVRPFDLMMGKILGIASVAVVQILLWGALVLVAGTVVLPACFRPTCSRACRPHRAAMRRPRHSSTPRCSRPSARPWMPDTSPRCSAGCSSSSWAATCSTRRCSPPWVRAWTTCRTPSSSRPRSPFPSSWLSWPPCR